ncbi:MAG: hypothetical protein WD716_02040 [Fimbriimonadaceae bacterium]
MRIDKPNGVCWCGCGKPTGKGAYFVSGHDKKAESAVMQIRYGGVAEMLVHHGFGPGGLNLHDEHAKWKAAGGKPR